MRARTSLADTWSKAPFNSSGANELNSPGGGQYSPERGCYQQVELREHLEESSRTPVIPVRNPFGGVPAA